MNEQEKMETQAAEAPLTRTELEEQLGALARQLTERLAQGEAQEQARSQALNQREEELHQREMVALARERLAAHGLPPALAEALRFADAESMEQGIALLEEAFRAAVQQGVEERLLLSAPKVIPVRPAGELSDAEYYAALAQFH